MDWLENYILETETRPRRHVGIGVETLSRPRRVLKGLVAMLGSIIYVDTVHINKD